MKTIEELNQSKSPIVIVSKRLEKYDVMPLFQDKVDKANAILAEHPPLLLFRIRENKRIKQYFEQDMLLAHIAKQVALSEAEVLLRLQEMYLVNASMTGE